VFYILFLGYYCISTHTEKKFEIYVFFKKIVVTVSFLSGPNWLVKIGIVIKTFQWDDKFNYLFKESQPLESLNFASFIFYYFYGRCSTAQTAIA
jgi:hypothetical protein